MEREILPSQSYALATAAQSRAVATKRSEFIFIFAFFNVLDTGISPTATSPGQDSSVSLAFGNFFFVAVSHFVSFLTCGQVCASVSTFTHNTSYSITGKGSVLAASFQWSSKARACRTFYEVTWLWELVG